MTAPDEERRAIGYCRLPGGRWGIGGEGEPPKPGDVLLVRRSDGAERSIRVGQIIERVPAAGYKPGRWTAKISPVAVRTPRRRAPAPPRCPACGGLALPGVRCSETGELHDRES